MLTLNLTPIFKARGIEKPYTFLVKSGFTSHSANQIINSKTRVFRLDHIELLCEVLNCEPNDLLLWKPEKDKVYSENNPLKKLQSDEATENIIETLSKLTYKELIEKSKDLNNKE